MREFRAAHPSKRVTVGGVGWNYIARGEGEEALLLLPGGAMVGKSLFTRIPAFEEGYRVIAPSYASVYTAAQLLDGLAGVLEAEGVQAAHVHDEVLTEAGPNLPTRSSFARTGALPPRAARGRLRSASPAWRIYPNSCCESLNAFEPHTKAEQDRYAEGLDQMERLNDARRMRLVAASESMPPILWVILISGGVVTVGFTYLFGLQNTWAHRLMVASLAAVITLVLFTIASLEHPFYGGTHVSPGAFEQVLDRFETSKLSDIR